DSAHRAVFLAELAHHAPQVGARSEEEDFVALVDDGVALGANAAPRAVNRDDARIRLRQVLANLAQRAPDERPALLRAYADERDFAVRELQHLKRARMTNQSLDVLRDELLGAD